MSLFRLEQAGIREDDLVGVSFVNMQAIENSRSGAP
jgi:hypothetical protein